MPNWKSRQEFWERLQVALGGWKIILALLVGTLMMAFAPYDFFDEASSDIVTVFGIVMAALVPAMLLAATSMRAGGFSVSSVRLLAKSLDEQMALFGTLFLYSLFGAVLVIVAKSFLWSLPALAMPFDPLHKINPSGVFNFLIGTVLTFLVIRLLDAIAGIRNILRLSSEIAVGEAFARSREQSKEEEPQP